MGTTGTAGFAEVDNGRLYHERAGEGLPVVLLHPSLWDRRILDPQFEALVEHHDVVRYDLRGYGRSDPPRQPYSDLRDLRSLLGGIYDIADAIAASVPGAAKRVVSEADHLVHVRKPEKLNRMVLDFLAFRE